MQTPMEKDLLTTMIFILGLSTFLRIAESFIVKLCLPHPCSIGLDNTNTLNTYIENNHAFPPTYTKIGAITAHK